MIADPRHMCAVSPGQALRLLASVPIGRVVFTSDALPAICLVDHAVVDGEVIIRCHDGAAVLTAIDQVVAYEADLIAPDTRRGWSVTITGKAALVEAAHDVARYEQALQPCVDTPMNQVIRIAPGLITGYELH